MGESLQVEGIARLGVDACVLLTPEELRDVLARRSLELLDASPHEAAVLVLQMRPSRSKRGSGADGTVAASQGAGSGGSYLADEQSTSELSRKEGISSFGSAFEDEVCVEKSRGFVMPSAWDPTPLYRTLPRGARSGPGDRIDARVGSLAVRESRQNGPREPAQQPPQSQPQQPGEALDEAPSHQLVPANQSSQAVDFGWAPDGSFVDGMDAADKIAKGSIARLGSEPLSRDASCEAAMRLCGRAFPRLAPELTTEVAAVCGAFLSACEMAGAAVADADGRDMAVAGGEAAEERTACSGSGTHPAQLEGVAALATAIELLFRQSQSRLKVKGTKEGKSATASKRAKAAKGGKEGKDSSEAGESGFSGGTGTVFALCREAISACICGMAAGTLGPVQLLRVLVGHPQERFIGSLLTAALSYSGLLNESAACSACRALLCDCLQGIVLLQPTLVLELAVMLGVREGAAPTWTHARAATNGAPSRAAVRVESGRPDDGSMGADDVVSADGRTSLDHAHTESEEDGHDSATVSRELVAAYIEHLARQEQWRVAAGLALELIHLVDCEALMVELAHAGEWKHAQTLAIGTDRHVAHADGATTGAGGGVHGPW